MPTPTDDIGVYMLRNRLTGDIYVGASMQMGNRLRAHLSQIFPRRPRRHWRPFQGAFNDCVEADVEIRVLERTTPELLWDREKHWIQTLRPTLNVHHVRTPIDTSLLPVGLPELA